MHAHDRARIGPDEPRERVIVKPALPVRRDEAGLHALRLQAEDRAQDGVVLTVGGDDMIARRKQARKRDIERMGGILREDHMVGARAAKQPCKLLTHRIHCARRAKARSIRTARAVAERPHCFQHRLRHTRGLLQRGGSVVKIDQADRSFSKSAAYRSARRGAAAKMRRQRTPAQTRRTPPPSGGCRRPA